MGEAAVAAAKAAGYEGAGTVEFIADGSGGLKAGGFWFMEMNTRLQVEHPVTEAVTGLDLVEWQFRIAAGEKLPLTQEQVPLNGHAVEARLYAEDPERGFLPSTGKLLALHFPQGEGLRVDTGVEAGSEVTPFYDPMIAKLIAHGNSRDEALDRLAAALDRTIVVGPRSNAGFLAALCRAAEFRDGNFDTGFIDRNLAELGAAPQGLDRAAAALGAQKLVERESARIAASSSASRTRRPRPGTPATPSSLPARAAWRCRSSPRARAWWRRSPTGRAAPRSLSTAPRRRTTRRRSTPATRSMCCATAARPRWRCAIWPSTRLGITARGGLVRAPMHGKVLAFWWSRAPASRAANVSPSSRR